MMADADKSHFDRILSNPEKFCTSFWTGTNGNKLIEALNSNNGQSRGSKICRLHEWWPHIYCVVSKNDLRREWKYCKVEITEKNTTTGVSNRMKTVRKEIMKTSDTRQNLGRFKNAGVVFVLPVKLQILDQITRSKKAYVSILGGQWIKIWHARLVYLFQQNGS